MISKRRQRADCPRTFVIARAVTGEPLRGLSLRSGMFRGESLPAETNASKRATAKPPRNAERTECFNPLELGDLRGEFLLKWNRQVGPTKINPSSFV